MKSDKLLEELIEGCIKLQEYINDNDELQQKKDQLEKLTDYINSNPPDEDMGQLAKLKLDLEEEVEQLTKNNTTLSNSDLNKMLQDCRELITKLYGKEFILENDTWPDIRFSSIGRNKFGECRVEIQTIYPRQVLRSTINISKVLQDMDEQIVKNTVMHEFIHSLKCCVHSQHFGKWREIADRVNKDTDYIITPNADGEEVEDFKDIYDNKHKTVYHLTCNNCGQELKYYTANADIVKHPENYTHRCPDGKKGTFSLEVEKR